MTKAMAKGSRTRRKATSARSRAAQSTARTIFPLAPSVSRFVVPMEAYP
jgi:hypothetical protein